MTAVLTAHARAMESSRPDRLFDDPLAEAFVRQAGLPVGLDHVAEFAGANFVLRTSFFDEELLAACAAGCRQVVLLAAGLDARAFRLDWPAGVRLFEVDLPALSELKERVIGETGAEPTCTRVVVPADLRTDWTTALVAAGFRPDEPTAWLIEGLMMFLRPEDNAGLLAKVGGLSAPGSRLALEHVNQAFRDLPQMRGVHERFGRMNASWHSHVDDPRAWLAGHGWDARVCPGVELAQRLGRPVPPIYDPAHVGDGRIWLVGARRAG